MAARRDGKRVQRLHLLRAQPDHPFDDIDTRDEFGNAMLNLQTGIHFQEIHLLGKRVVEELNGSGGAIPNGRHKARRPVCNAQPHRQWQVGRRGFFHYLLVAPLHRTIAITQYDNLAHTIAEHLNFDVPGARNIAFQIDARVAEAAFRHSHYGGECLIELRWVLAHRHADAAATCAALQHHGKADGCCRCLRMCCIPE